MSVAEASGPSAASAEPAGSAAKVVAVLWDDGKLSRAERRRLLVEDCAPELLRSGSRYLTMCIADEEADVPAPSPFPLFAARPAALVNLWPESEEGLAPLLETLRARGFVVEAYRAAESVVTDYGDNGHSEPRDWPDGVRSPGVTAVSLFGRPRRLGHDEWIRRWHGVMSPLSAGLQPRTRYVRNVLTERIGEGEKRWDGIVEECWPSPRHVSNPFLYYGAGWNPLLLLINAVRILWAVTRFLRITRVPVVMMGEYLLRPPDAAGP